MEGQFKSWTGTDYVPIDKWHQLVLNDKVEYAAYQLEECPKTGRRHIQWFLKFKIKKKFNFVKKFLGDTTHIEKCKNVAASRNYCMKEESRIEGPFEHGEWRGGRGRRSDLEEIQEAINNGEPETAIAEGHFGDWVRYRQAFREYRNLVTARRTWPMEIKVLWGPTGTGKTQQAWEEAGADAFLVQPGLYPFTGYNGQANIIWDEFSGSSCDIKYLLQLTDRYPMTVRGLYSTYNFVGKKIWITSNIAPDQWYPNAHPEHNNALQRRLNEFGVIINKNL